MKTFGDISMIYFSSPKERLEGARVILIVPGNPGLASFYEVPLLIFWPKLYRFRDREKNIHQSTMQEFMLVLQKELSEEPLSIWAVSHIGAFVGGFYPICQK